MRNFLVILPFTRAYRTMYSVRVMQITRIAFTACQDQDATLEFGGRLSSSDLEDSLNPIEDLAELRFGECYREGRTHLPSGWKGADDEAIIRIMAHHKDANVYEALWQECLRYAANDFMTWKAWQNDDWTYQIITATVYGKNDPSDDEEEETELASQTCGGVQSTADEYAERKNKRTGRTRIAPGQGGIGGFVEPYRTEVARENAQECRAEIEAAYPGIDLSGWDRLVYDASVEGIEEVYD